ncbi:MAG: hypothetical protein II937_13605 [Bacteroidales bacterium]|nr:hypothetical protein [Bacteroidales bacterium]
MFSDRWGLTAAVLNGTKTQTRRIINAMPKVPQISYGLEEEAGYVHLLDGYIVVAKSRYKVGEIVAVAQPYKAFYGDFKEPLRTELIDSAGFMNKMFVRAELMPHQIEITNIRVERLQDISDEDCMAEGIIKYANGVYTYTENGKKTFHADLDTPRKAYAELIDKISGKGTWAGNPYVFAYNFDFIK